MSPTESTDAREAEFDRLTIDVRHCARCGRNHADLPVKPFARPERCEGDWKWWTTCPTWGEPILIVFN